VVRALARRAVVASAGGESGLVEARDRRLPVGLEGEVQVFRGRAVLAHEELVRVEVALAALHAAVERAQGGFVEAATGGEIADAEMNVVEQAADVVLHAPTIARACSLGRRFEWPSDGRPWSSSRGLAPWV
jgi:hypothetical protein